MPEAGAVRLVGQCKRLRAAGEDPGVVAPGPEPIPEVEGDPFRPSREHAVVVDDQDSHARPGDTARWRVTLLTEGIGTGKLGMIHQPGDTTGPIAEAQGTG